MKGYAAVCFLLFFISIFNLLVNPTSNAFGAGTINYGSGDAESILYDASGHAVCFKNGTKVSGGEDGRLLVAGNAVDALELRLVPLVVDAVTGAECADASVVRYAWANTSNNSPVAPRYIQPYFALYESSAGVAGGDALSIVYDVALNSPLGFLSIIGIIMTVSLLIGVKIFGTGTSEFGSRAFVMGGAYIGMFLLCSAGAYYPILSLPFNLGVILYLALTGIATFSLFGKFASGGGGSD